MAKKPTPGTSPSSPDELPEGRYSDRELSWLAFNERVLDLARDTERIPLLERAKFLAIFSSNLDEFFHGASRRSQTPYRRWSRRAFRRWDATS
ncbi:polyphosphate kinase [Cutibacterium acnes JCM 18916]|nr:polyphosphate kinase [Cutibacterium acnes JCM 18916]